jgi:hypothetical protein
MGTPIGVTVSDNAADYGPMDLDGGPLEIDLKTGMKIYNLGPSSIDWKLAALIGAGLFVYLKMKK